MAEEICSNLGPGRSAHSLLKKQGMRLRQIEQQLERAGVPGCAIAFTGADGSPCTLEHGWADLGARRAVEPATQFHLFSGTKLYTATAIMLLVERGALELDASVRSYMPELPLNASVTVRHLASHASGLPDTLAAFLAVHFPGDPTPTSAEALGPYRLTSGKPPGQTATYRNVNYAILGALIERVTKRSFTQFIKEEVLSPLGADLSFGFEPEHDGPSATGYIPRFSFMRLVLRLTVPRVAARIYGPRQANLVSLNEFSLDTAAIGGLIGSAAQFLPLIREMLIEGDGLLRARSKREMLTLWSRGAAGIVSRDGVGLAWKRGTANGVEFWNHEGGGPGFCSETRIYPSDDFGIVVLMNRSQSSALSKTCHELCEVIRAEHASDPIVSAARTAA